VDGTNVSRIPAISMVFYYTMNATGGTGQAMSFPFAFRVKAKYTYRGRVLTDPMGVLSKHMLAEHRKEIAALLPAVS
jgi:hypothetical protein